MITTITDVPAYAAAYINTQAPNPGPSAPPGADDFTLVLSWVFWIALFAGVLGFVIAGVMMMMQSRGRGGDGTEAVARVGWVAVGCVIVASASGLVNQFA